MAETPASERGVAPVSQGERISSLDTLRGFALLGILLMNIVGFGLPLSYENPTVAGWGGEANFNAWAIPNVLAEGTMRGMFSMLFGASIVLLVGRMERAGAGITAADVHFRRMLWMMLFGFIHWALLLWYGEILFAYSICGILLFAFRNMAPRLQIGLGVALLFIAAISSANSYYNVLEMRDAALEAQAEQDSGATLSKEQQATLEKWKEKTEEFNPPQELIEEVIAAHRGTYLNAVEAQFPASFHFQWVTLPWWLLFDMVPFMLIGMGLLGTGVLSAQRSTRFYLAMLVGGYGIGIPLNLFELNALVAGGFDAVAATKSSQTYELSRFAMVIGHAGLLLTIIRLGLLQWLQRVLAAVGQMALTNYIAQTVICTALFYGFGFDLFDRLQRYELFYVVAGVWLAEMIWSPLWLRHFRFGPIEWLWRTLTYGTNQPMRR